LQFKERRWHALLHCYILFFIGQNFVYFNASCKMPSDKKAICNLSHITPAPFAINPHRANHDAIATKPLTRIGSF
jgi:hypothetical protein